LDIFYNYSITLIKLEDALILAPTLDKIYQSGLGTILEESLISIVVLVRCIKIFKYELQH